jgi:hypothetical protein
MRQIKKKMDQEEEPIQINFDDIEVTDSHAVASP